MHCFKLLTFVIATLATCHSVIAQAPRTKLIFPLEHWHNHGSCLVECPNGDLLACWFHGSGERTADDVQILGARLVKKTGNWTKPFPMADTPGFPDTNCCMIIDGKQTLWLLWPTIQANRWESALMKIKKSSDYMMPTGPPKWNTMSVMHVKHSGDFAKSMQRKLADYIGDARLDDRGRAWVESLNEQATDKLTRRIGWFTRAHPLILSDGRMLVGLYSDGFSFSLVGITDDDGKTWRFSEPLVGAGNIQPSFATRKNGNIVAFMRDNGPPPKRILVSESSDRGETWSRVTDHPSLPNPGAGLELMSLRNGDWLCIYNDTPKGRHRLAVSLSQDEGKTWNHTRYLENDPSEKSRYHYPSIIESNDGTLHATYSYFVQTPQGERKSIKYATFGKQWLLQGDSEGGDAQEHVGVVHRRKQDTGRITMTQAQPTELLPAIKTFLDAREDEFDDIPQQRRKELSKLAAYVGEQHKSADVVQLTFICTHNSRRSHLAQIWSKVAADYCGLTNVESFSGGTEATAMNPRVVDSLRRAGLRVEADDPSSGNPKYQVQYSNQARPLVCFSKVYDQPPNPTTKYCAVMTCSSADDACPIVPGCELRLPIRYEDPKIADGTPEESSLYDERSRQICREMLYAMRQVANQSLR